MKTCPFCVESIQDEAIKCRFCGEFLDAAPGDSGPAEITAVEQSRQGKIVTWLAECSPRELLKFVDAAAQAAGLPVTERSFEDLSLTFESRGMTMYSMAGERVRVMVSPTGSGSKAVFTAKSKPKGMARIESAVNARKYTDKLVSAVPQVSFTRP